MRSSKMSEISSSKKIEIPFYKVDPQVVESVEYKLDRVSKYIASLKSIQNTIFRKYQECLGEPFNKI